jgi:hypothetical protein
MFDEYLRIEMWGQIRGCFEAKLGYNLGMFEGISNNWRLLKKSLRLN